MDYQFVCVLQIILIGLVAHLHFADAIVGRDVFLTPKRDLQLNGKSIFYEEEAIATTTHNQTLLRPWERTLKHVTFVTLFTNAAAGNVSQQKAYSNFLHSPYIPQPGESNTRFGDIVTLANGRLEVTGNNSFRFVEGLCGYDCDAEHVWALWQVQKIRHRDTNRKFRYEMKFSVSPLRTESVGNIKRKAELDSNNSKRSVLQTYIQRDDDYPKTFGKIVYNDEARFADRRLDDYVGRNFRHAPMNAYRQATPMPQPTFMHGIFQPPPHFPPPHEKLNIGEYIKDYTPKATPKIELFPNILNAVSRNYYTTPTTFRPNYQTKFPRPELYTPTSAQEAIKYPQNTQVTGVSGDGVGKLSTPVVTHHFHHHFYMPTTTSIENGLGSAEQPINKPTSAYKSEAPEATAPTYFNNYYNERVQASHQQRPQSQKLINFAHMDTELHKEHVVQVTPVPPLKRPHIYQMYQIPIDAKVPLLIYPAPVLEAQPTSPHNKPFIRSEPMADELIHYSEPDPLYLNLAHNPSLDGQSYELSAPQLEAPKINPYEEFADVHISTVASRKNTKPDSIAAQLPPPDSEQDVRIPYEDETEPASKHKNDLEQKPSQKDVHISVKNKLKIKLPAATAAPTISSTTAEFIETSSNTPAEFTTTTTTSNSNSITTTTELDTTSNQLESIKTSASAVQTTTTMPTTNSLLSATTAMPSTTSIDDTDVSSKQNKFNFVSTSTSETPTLRGFGRYRLKHIRPSTTTTEQPVLKWKPRRKHVLPNKSTANSHAESEVMSQMRTTKREQPQEPQPANGQRHEKQLTTAATTNSTKTGNNTALTNSGNEIFEVLTQKSVSKSVSIKVGNNGEEIPVIVDDGDYGENEVKTD